MNELKITATVTLRASWRDEPTEQEANAARAMNAALAVFAATVARDLERQMAQAMTEVPA